MTESIPTKCRLLRTGTLVLIAVVLLIGGGALMVWLPYHRNQMAITEVERLGGEAFSEIVRSAWIPGAVDDEYLWLFERVWEIDLSNTQVCDEDLEQLRGLTKLEILWLSNTQISDAGLVHLRDLTNLDDLRLINTQVSDAGLEFLRGLTNLSALSLDGTRISDAGVDHLRGLPNIQYLMLDGTQVTKAGYEKLRKSLPNSVIEGTPSSE